MSKLFDINSSATFKVPTSKMVGTSSIPQKKRDTHDEIEPGDNKAAEWVADKDSDSCMICYDKFSLTKRRHHCRICGKLVCAKCSENKTKITDKQERVCDTCFEQVSGEDSSLCVYPGCTSPKLSISTGRGYCMAHHKDAEKKDDTNTAREKARDLYNYFCKLKPSIEVMTKTRFLRCASDLKLANDGKDGQKAVSVAELQRWFGIDEEADGEEEIVDFKQFFKGLAEYARRINYDLLEKKKENDECVSYLMQQFKQKKTLDHLNIF